MSDVEKITNEFQDILCHYKQNQNRILLQVLNDIQSSKCTHNARSLGIQNKINCIRRTTGSYQLLLFLIILVCTCSMYGMWLIRRYNHASIYGGCPTSFLWPFDECPVAF